MALIANVFLDAALTTQFDDAVHTLDAFAVNGGSGDGVFYFGTATATNKVQATSDPGINPITVSIVDATPGVDVLATHISLALTQVGLDTAIAGDPLDLGATVNGGAVNAVPVWFRWANSIGTAVYTDISLSIVPTQESAI